ncbi:GerMN domain-containing protein [Phormidium pseudopriestleyi FRX01]|uniref:GerMN domain-containing protein n=1 Tax=Phormidium pseudopriestleyi FRX01 TaxID=1759528 RepID=A0ABS3FRY8_9CYAN|nr:GerMN domain-containing protein [Phormidium pseudopriestleyi]MBO0349798.1 GerMN domain-containing protein [Phormidium pseudopriestleyi FRX01]
MQEVFHLNSILKKYIAQPIVGITLVILLSVTGCGTPPTTTDPGMPSSPSNGAVSPDTQQPQAVAMANVTIYEVDSQCQELLPQTVSVTSDRPIEAAVGQVIQNAGTVDFNIVGYRVTVDNTTGVATVDLRADPNSQRQFVSLSSCERFSLFGSLERTLTENPQWQIQTVEFTERGEPLDI